MLSIYDIVTSYINSVNKIKSHVKVLFFLKMRNMLTYNHANFYDT